MPNPIIADFWRAQVVFQGKSGLPEDQFVNTFTFRNEGVASRSQMVDAINERINAFYDVPVTQTGQSISSFLTSILMNAAYRVKVYDLGEAPPRTVSETEQTLTLLPAAAPLPPEVACVASFFGQKNTPRTRGRVFLGPLAQAATEVRNGSVFFTEAFRTTVAHAMRRQTQNGQTNIARWHVVSTTYGTATPVLQGWVDDAPDTQRRRGAKATTRLIWTESGVG